jgi:hypothetical protein
MLFSLFTGHINNKETFIKMTVTRNFDSRTFLRRTPERLLRHPPSRPFARPRCVFKPLSGYVIYANVNETKQKRIFYLPADTENTVTQNPPPVRKPNKVSPMAEFETFVMTLFCN